MDTVENGTNSFINVYEGSDFTECYNENFKETSNSSEEKTKIEYVAVEEKAFLITSKKQSVLEKRNENMELIEDIKTVQIAKAELLVAQDQDRKIQSSCYDAIKPKKESDPSQYVNEEMLKEYVKEIKVEREFFEGKDLKEIGKAVDFKDIKEEISKIEIEEHNQQFKYKWQMCDEYSVNNCGELHEVEEDTTVQGRYALVCSVRRLINK